MITIAETDTSNEGSVKRSPKIPHKKRKHIKKGMTRMKAVRRGIIFHPKDSLIVSIRFNCLLSSVKFSFIFVSDTVGIGNFSNGFLLSYLDGGK
jgi:hypothetical protein